MKSAFVLFILYLYNVYVHGKLFYEFKKQNIMEELIEKVEELLQKNAENVSANHWINAIHEDKFSELAPEIVKLFSMYGVVQQRELLKAFYIYCSGFYMNTEHYVNDRIEGFKKSLL